MSEVIITPEGHDAVQVGTFIDDDGDRFVVLTFTDPAKPDRYIVTFTPTLFRDYAAHLGRIAGDLDNPDIWQKRAD